MTRRTAEGHEVWSQERATRAGFVSLADAAAFFPGADRNVVRKRLMHAEIPVVIVKATPGKREPATVRWYKARAVEELAVAVTPRQRLTAAKPKAERTSYADRYAQKTAARPVSALELSSWGKSEAASDLASALASVGWATYAEAVAARCGRGCDDATRARWQRMHARWSLTMKTRARMPVALDEKRAAE
jgi:hypothetical protein